MNLKDFTEKYISQVVAQLNSVSDGEVDSFFEEIKNTTITGGRIYFIGNGGSASTCSHFANDLSRCEIEGAPVRAISLCENNSLITAIANDFGYENIFKLQLKRELSQNDLVVAVSVSGNSENLLKAIEYTSNRKIKSFALLGSNGGALQELVNSSIHISSGAEEFGPVEDVHLVLNHLISNYIRRNFT